VAASKAHPELADARKLTVTQLIEAVLILDNHVSKTEFRNAMARVCSPVNVITTAGPAGRGGVTATAMCSVSDEPPTLLVCINNKSTQTKLFQTNGKFCVNVLSAEHQNLAGIFAGSVTKMDDRFVSTEWIEIENKLPALKSAMVSFACEVIDIQRVASHNIMIGRVFQIHQRADGSPLLYFDRHYVQLN